MPTVSSSSWIAARRSRVAVCEVEQSVPEPADAEVELEDGGACRRGSCTQLVERVREVVGASDVETDGMLDALLDENLPASGLRAQPVQRGVAAVDRQLKRLRHADLIIRHAERDDHRDLGLTDEPLDPLESARPREELPGQRLVSSVDERDRLEPAPRFRRVELGDEREVVVDDTRVDRLRRHVDHA